MWGLRSRDDGDEDRSTIQGPGCGHRQAGNPAFATAFVCDTPRAKQRRYSLGPTNARPCRYFDHADLHACHQHTAQEKLRTLSPAGKDRIAKKPSIQRLQLVKCLVIIKNLLFGSKSDHSNKERASMGGRAVKGNGL